MTGINVLNMIETHIDKQIDELKEQRAQLVYQVRELTAEISKLELHRMLTDGPQRAVEVVPTNYERDLRSPVRRVVQEG